MSRLKVAVAITIIAVLFIFVSCTTTEDDPAEPGGGSYFIYDGTTFTLASAIIEDYGANTEPGESGYDLDFWVATSGVDLINWTGIGDLVVLDLNSPNSTLAPGTYTWSDTRTDFTLVDSVLIINYNLDTGAGTFVWVIDGTATVSVNGDTYTVEFTLDLIDGKTVTGRYSGPAPVF